MSDLPETPGPNGAAVPERGAPGTTALADYWRILRSYRWLIVGVTLVVFTAVLAWSFRQPRIYSASCSIEYDPNPVRPLGEGVEDVAAPTSDFWMSREFFETQNRIISSRVVAERVVRRLGLHTDRTFFDDGESYPADWRGRDIEDTAVTLQERVNVELQRGTRIVLITVRDRSPERAALIANTIADVYIEKTIEDRLDSTVRALEWLGEQLDNLRRGLDESELALHRFKQEHNILSVSMEDRQNLVAQEIERFSEALATARTERIEVNARLGRIRSLVSGDSVEDRSAALGDVPTITTLRGQIITKITERDRIALRYGDSHPSMRELNTEIDALRHQLDVELDAVLRSAEADVREITQTEAGIRQALEDAHDAGLDLNLREIEYMRLNRARENNAKLYQIVLERTTETDLTRMLRMTHVRMVDRALQPRTHVSPRMSVNGSLGLAAGLALGLAFAVALSRMDRRLRSARDVEDLGVPVLGILPSIENDELARSPARARRGRRQRDPSLDDTARPLIVHTHPMSSVAEHCRIIRTNLMFMGANRPLRTLVVSSPEPREGKTTVTTNLSIAIAQSGKRVLLVDTDLRRPRVHSAFGLPNRIGVSSYLVGQHTLEEAVQRTDVPNLTVLACGPIPPNPSELLHVQRFADLIRTAQEHYDFIVFDSPPLGVVTDAAVIAPQVDGMLLVIKSAQTTREALNSVVRRLRAVGARIVGGVLNDVDPRGGQDGYGEGYYYYRGGYYSEASAPEEPPRPESQLPQ